MYVIIISNNPTLQQCNHQLSRHLDLMCLIVLKQLAALAHNAREHHTDSHLPPLIMIHFTTTTIIAYNYINQRKTNNKTITQQSLEQLLPFLLQRLLKTITKFSHPVTRFIHTPYLTHDKRPHLYPHTTNTTNTHIITLNTFYISSSLPDIMQLIDSLHYKSNINLLPATKLPKLKQTTYIDKFPELKISLAGWNGD